MDQVIQWSLFKNCVIHFFLACFLGVSVLHYLQTVMPNVAVGGEVAYQYGSGIPGGGIAVVSGVGRYTGM